MNDYKFGILDSNGDYLISLCTDGQYTSGSLQQGKKMNVVELEKWLKIIKFHKIEYKVKSIPIQEIS